LFFFQQSAEGDFEAGWSQLERIFSDPHILGFDFLTLRFACFLFIVFFAFVRLLMFTFLKSHNLEDGAKPRVLLSSDGAYPSVHGVATFNTTIAARLRDEKYPCHIITGSPAFEEKDVNQIVGVPCTRVPCVFTHVGPQTPLGLPNPIQLTQILAGFRPHIVHILEPGSALNIALIFVCWIACIPVLVSNHTHTMEYRLTMSTLNHTASKYILYFNYRVIICLADLHVSVTKMIMDASIHGVISWSWLHIRTPNGHPPMFWATGSSEEFDISHHNEEMRNELSNGNPNAHVIIHVGRFVDEKNIMDYLPVAHRMCDKYGDKVQFALVGWGPRLAPFVQSLVEAGHGDRVKAMNTLTGEQLYQAYASSDIFFSPSASEALPIVYLEALRSGLVVISPNGPNAGGSQHTFTPGKHGFQYPRGDTHAAVEAIEKAMRVGKTMQKECMNHGQQFTWRRTMDECLGFYDLVLRSRHVLND
jgi:glycosyltransferase involved in cell wall biosynthesis